MRTLLYVLACALVLITTVGAAQAQPAPPAPAAAPESAETQAIRERIKKASEAFVAAARAHQDDCAAMTEAARPHLSDMLDGIRDLVMAHKDDPTQLQALMANLEAEIGFDPAALGSCAEDPQMQQAFSELTQAKMEELMPILMAAQGISAQPGGPTPQTTPELPALSAEDEATLTRVEAEITALGAQAQAHAGDCQAMVGAVKPHFEALMSAMAELVTRHDGDPMGMIGAMQAFDQRMTTLSDSTLTQCEEDPAFAAMVETAATAKLSEIQPILERTMGAMGGPPQGPSAPPTPQGPGPQ